MTRWRAGEVAAVTGGRIVAGEADTSFEGAVLDSRAVQGGELFVALPAGHAGGGFGIGSVADALDRGAAAALVSEPVPGLLGRRPGRWAVIEVGDTLRAIHDLARRARERTPRHLVGVTGSAGKTTTKELLAAMLAQRYRVARSRGNLNNLKGFPVALLSVPENTEWMVAEMGMSAPGELRELSLLGRPDVALFTVIRPVHLAALGSLRAITEAKAELLAGLAPDGLVVANADDPEVSRIARRHRGPVLWYGIRSPADVMASDLDGAAAGRVGSRFLLTFGGASQEVALSLHGLYNIENCLAAAAVACALGVSLEAIAAAVREVEPAVMRGVVHELSGHGRLIDDTFNSHPDGLRRALEAAALLPAGRRWAILGDMLELGPEGPRFHREAGEWAAELGFSPVIGVGELSRELIARARVGGAAVDWFPDSRAAAAWASGEVRAGDLILVKGSRGVGLEAVVQCLLARHGHQRRERPDAGQRHRGDDQVIPTLA